MFKKNKKTKKTPKYAMSDDKCKVEMRKAGDGEC